MGLISKTALLKWNSRNKKHYVDKGYLYTYIGDAFEVDVNDLTIGSNAKILACCNHCEKIIELRWCDFRGCTRDNNAYYCKSCVQKLYGIKTSLKTRLNNSKSFEEWCLVNNKIEILNLWDYNANTKKPCDIFYSTNVKYWFKCPIGKHGSELKSISKITTRNQFECKQCTTFAQWGIDNICGDFLNKYWDWEKNNELNINPWEISYGTNNTKIWIKCQDEKCHNSYFVSCHNFCGGSRCPTCNQSKGELKIKKYLLNNNIIHISQKGFNGLVGINNGNLSYDFYLPQLNLLIEYQGEQHERYIKGFHKTIKDFERQLEHDRRKREYAEQNSIKLLEIWHWNFDNIEQILKEKLKEGEIIDS